MVSERIGNFLRVLIACDDPLFAEALTRTLSAMPCAVEVVRAERPADALEPAPPGRFDLAFLCLDGGRHDVGAAVEAGRRAASGAPLAVLGTEPSPGLVRAAIAAGAAGFLDLPCGPEEIRHAVEVMLSGGVHLPRAAALEAGGRLPGADPDFGEVRLSRRQAGILRGMLAGRTEVEIAGDLGLTPAVVRLHRAALLRALERAGPASDVRPLAAPETIEVGRAQLAETRGAGPGEAAAADMLDALFNAVPAPLIATRAAGPVGFPQIVYVNDHFCEFYGMTRPFLLRSTTGVLAGPKTDLSRLRAMRRRVGEEIVRVAMTSYGGRGDAKRVRIDIARFPYGPAAGEGTLWLALHVPLFDLGLPDRRGE